MPAERAQLTNWSGRARLFHSQALLDQFGISLLIHRPLLAPRFQEFTWNTLRVRGGTSNEAEMTDVNPALGFSDKDSLTRNGLANRVYTLEKQLRAASAIFDGEGMREAIEAAIPSQQCAAAHLWSGELRNACKACSRPWHVDCDGCFEPIRQKYVGKLSRGGNPEEKQIGEGVYGWIRSWFHWIFF